MKYVVGVSFILGNMLFAHQAYAEGTATKIIQHGERTMRGNSTQALMSMTIKRPNFTRTLKIRSWSAGTERALVEILEPKKEQGVASLRVDGNMWNYLPKVDQTVRVPTSLMLQSWMGSDFTNDDLMKASSLATDYQHKILGNETLNGDKTVKILCIPKPGAPVVWGKIIYWARTRDQLPVQQSFYDEDNKWVRTIQLSVFKKMDDRVVPTRVEVRTAENKAHSTVVTYEKLLYDRRIDLEIFRKEHLRQNAQKGRVITAGWSLSPLR
ncbi:MAG: outer membrane lipoprotein-sorting protein [Bdellovibrionales bacterium]|nr:outer membrane lipoprotein-sorting protein [Bdellovibrionales bacterium]